MKPAALLVAIALSCACASDQGRRVNPGAEVAVYQDADEAWLQSFRPDTQRVRGLYFNGIESIHVAGYISKGDRRFIHEYQHMLEARLEAAGDHIGLVLVRNAFRALCGPTFELGHSDLMETY